MKTSQFIGIGSTNNKICLLLVILFASLLIPTLVLSKPNSDLDSTSDEDGEEVKPDQDHSELSLKDRQQVWKQAKCLQPTAYFENHPRLTERLAFRFDILDRQCKPYMTSAFRMFWPENHFETMQGCLELCRKKQPEPTCSLLPEPGFTTKWINDCRQYSNRWFHSKGKCHQFIYTGCGGNMNNFPDERSCLHFCKGKGELRENTDYGYLGPIGEDLSAATVKDIAGAKDDDAAGDNEADDAKNADKKHDELDKTADGKRKKSTTKESNHIKTNSKRSKKPTRMHHTTKNPLLPRKKVGTTTFNPLSSKMRKDRNLPLASSGSSSSSSPKSLTTTTTTLKPLGGEPLG